MTHDYTESEAQDRKLLTEVKLSLMAQMRFYKLGAEATAIKMRNVDRCQDCWTAETLFRRGIPLSNANSVNFGEESMEVDNVE